MRATITIKDGEYIITHPSGVIGTMTQQDIEAVIAQLRKGSACFFREMKLLEDLLKELKKTG